MPPRDRLTGIVLGRDVGAMFQDPMTSLNPLFTVESQLTESDAGSSQAGQGSRAVACPGIARIRRHPRAGAAPQGLSPPIVRRSAPARRDRCRAIVRSQARGRRRTDDGARRVGAGADPQAPARSRRQPRHRHPARHAQHGRRGPDCRPRHHHASRQGRRNRPDGRGSAPPEGRLCQGADRRRPAHRPAPRPFPGRRRGRQGSRGRCPRGNCARKPSAPDDGRRWSAHPVGREPVRRLHHQRLASGLERPSLPRGRRCQLLGPQRRGVRARGRIRLRQDHHRQCRLGPRAPHRGARALSRAEPLPAKARPAGSGRCAKRSR